MNRISAFVVSAAVLAGLGSGAAIAATGTKKSPEVKAERLLARYDTDKDGIVTLDEVRQRVKLAFDKADGDHDGKLTKAEYDAARPKASPAKREKTFNKLDANHDGAVTLDEIEAKTTHRFAKFDLNHDGKVTRDEALTRLTEKAAKKAKKAG
jgi:Ca2+-binding EF-hand superfamily protein